jgi:hypothetical protein
MSDPVRPETLTHSKSDAHAIANFASGKITTL